MTIAILISSIAIAISITSLAISIQTRKRCGEIEKVLHDVDNERKIDRKYINGLTSCHEAAAWSWGDYRYSHSTAKAQTETANGVTFEELAKLVLDGTPIRREVPETRFYNIRKETK